MDCASCAAKIEKAVRSVGVEDVKVSTATQIMTLHVHDPDARLPEVERAVTGIGYKLDRLDAPSVDTEGDSDDRSEEHPSELQSLMRISYAVFCLKQKTK